MYFHFDGIGGVICDVGATVCEQRGANPINIHGDFKAFKLLDARGLNPPVATIITDWQYWRARSCHSRDKSQDDQA